jgi:Family of unknown function (DUF6599)
VTKRTISGALLLVLVWEISALAQGLLPGASGGWTATGAASLVAPAQLASVAAGQADVLREYGVTSAEQRQYTRGSQTAAVTVYHMTDPTAAYGAFTLLRDAQMQPLDLGDSVSYCAAADDRAVFVVGNFLLTARSSSGERPSDAALSEIGAVLAAHADTRPYPLIAGYLPRSSTAPGTQRFPLGRGASVALPARMSLVPDSERYVLGLRALRAVLGDAFPATTEDWIGFGNSAEAIAARYRTAGASPQELTLLVTLYPTQQIAASQFADLGKWMALNVAPNQAGGRAVVYGSRSSALMALVFGAASQDAADQLINQIQYHSSVTWNEPSHSFTDPSFPTMIIGVFQGTGLFMLMAFAAGIGFGGFRLLTKLVMPGRVFDRDSDVEILQLGLTTKPIDSRDFY